ncbi:MAG: hypothetical protein WAQ99_05600 [Pyrinomonadaceae bacterium]
MKRVLIVVLAVLLGLAGYLFFTRSNPVIYRYVDQAAGNYSAFVILNPLRDHEPERQAEVVLQGLKARDCRSALSVQQLDSERIKYLCERENKYPIESWNLMDRKGDGRKTQLIYDVNRPGSEGKPGSSLAWIDVENNGTWRATRYDTFY